MQNTCEAPQRPEIKELFDLVGNFKALIGGERYIYYDSGDIRIKGRGVINVPETLGVQIIYMAKGERFVPHKHTGKEWGYIFKGRLDLEYNGDSRIVTVGEMISYNPGQSHGGTALEDTEILFISADAHGYPDGEIRLRPVRNRPAPS